MKKDERREFRRLVERGFAPAPTAPTPEPKPRGERDKPLTERFMPVPPANSRKG